VNYRHSHRALSVQELKSVQIDLSLIIAKIQAFVLEDVNYPSEHIHSKYLIKMHCWQQKLHVLLLSNSFESFS
jgi:hypothetical protein